MAEVPGKKDQYLARENTDFYGPTYSDRRMSLEGVSVDESEDYYRV